jgi:predicted nucleic acid-binding protein
LTAPLSAYVDTNIFDYVALKHPKYGLACKKITDDIRDGRLKAYCSYLVPMEILGSLARVDRKIAAGAILAFFSFPIDMIPIDERIIREASDITLETGVGYDAIHAAAMRRRDLRTIITEDIEHWRKIGGIRILRPLEYS